SNYNSSRVICHQRRNAAQAGSVSSRSQQGSRTGKDSARISGGGPTRVLFCEVAGRHRGKGRLSPTLPAKGAGRMGHSEQAQYAHKEKQGMRSHAVERTSIAPVPNVGKKPMMRDLVSTRDLSPSEVRSILDLAAVVKARPADFRRTLEGKQLVMFFEKPS